MNHADKIAAGIVAAVYVAAVLYFVNTLIDAVLIAVIGTGIVGLMFVAMEKVK